MDDNDNDSCVCVHQVYIRRCIFLLLLLLLLFLLLESDKSSVEKEDGDEDGEDEDVLAVVSGEALILQSILLPPLPLRAVPSINERATKELGGGKRLLFQSTTTEAADAVPQQPRPGQPIKSSRCHHSALPTFSIAQTANTSRTSSSPFSSSSSCKIGKG